MADTKRDLATLQDLLKSGEIKNVSAQDLRDFLVSVFADIDYGGTNHLTAENIKDAFDKRHTHDNKTILDAIQEALTTALKTAYDQAVTDSHTHSNKTILDAIQEALTTALKTAYDQAVTDSHTHSNKTILDAIQEALTTALKTAYDQAVTDSHTHSNKAILDAIQEAFTTALKDAYDDAVTKKHTQGTDTTLGTQAQDLNMGTHKITGVVDPTTPQEGATKKYVDDNAGGGGVLSTTGAEPERPGVRLGLTLPAIPILETYDGSGQTVHPSVIYISGGFGGYEYWMANTPYPDGDDTKENPSIWASHDGLKWVIPPGLTNPIVPQPASGHNSDTELVYDSGTLYCFYRPNKVVDTNKINRIQSTDGITWTNIITVLSSDTETFASPTIFKDGTTWIMYYVNVVPNPNEIIKRTSTDLTTWTAPVSVTVNNIPTGKDLWHLSVIKTTDYEMFLTVCDSGVNGANTLNYFATGSTTTEFTVQNKFTDFNYPWEQYKQYRGTMVVTPNNISDISLRDVWYGAFDRDGHPQSIYTIHQKAKRKDNNLYPYLAEELYIPKLITESSLSSSLYTDRGDITDYDYTLSGATLIADDTWRDLDLSSIIPSDSIGILVRILVKGPSGKCFLVRNSDYSSTTKNLAKLYAQVTDTWIYSEGIITVNSLSKIKYLINADMVDVKLLIAGWWK